MNKNVVLLLSVFLLSNKGIHTAPIDAARPAANWIKISPTDLASASNQQYIISSGGNYMLTGDIAPSTTSATSIIHINADNVTLDLAGHTIDGNNSEAADFGIEVSGHDNVTIQNGNIARAKGASIQIGTSSSNVRVCNITITNPADTYDGIVIATSERNITLENIAIVNDATASTGHGISVTGSPQSFVIDNFTVSGLNHASGRSAIVIAGGYNIKLSNGRISNITGDTESDGILFSSACYDIEISNIKMSNISGQGIDLNASYNVTMRDINIANVAGGHGITISGVGYNIVLDGFQISNLNTAATAHGINLGDGTYGITLKNGSITNTAGATVGHAINLAGSHRGVLIENIEMVDLADSGINVQTICDNLIMRNLKITNPTVSGIDVSGACNNIIGQDIVLSEVGTGDGIRIGGAAIGVNLSDIDISGGSDGIAIVEAAKNISIHNLNLTSQTSDGISIASSVEGITLKNVNITTSGGDGISIGGSADDFVLENFSITDPTTVAIDLDGGCNNVVVKNGTIRNPTTGINVANSTNNYLIENVKISGASVNGITVGTTVQNMTIKNSNVASSTTTNIAFGAGCYGITLDGVDSTGGKDGITFIGTAGTATIASDIVIKNCNISGTTRSDDGDPKSIDFSFAQNILIQDTNVGKCTVTTAGEEAFGVYLNTCTNVKCENVNSGGHLGDGAYGFSLTNVNGAVFNNCESIGNYAIDSTSTETCVGFFVETSTAVTFNNCVSSGHTSGREAQGFLYSNAIGCITENCVANGIRNSAAAPNSTEAMFTGFFSVNGIGNMWKNCIAENNFAGTATGQDGEGAIGFYLSSELQSALIGCKSRGHGSLYAHTANAIGVYLDNRRSRTGMKKEDCQYCQIRACEASSNCTSALTGVTAYGIRDVSADTKNIIIECFAFGNSDSATPTRVVTNYNMDLAVGATTPANWPRIETNMDGLIDLANTPDFYNVSITS